MIDHQDHHDHHDYYDYHDHHDLKGYGDDDDKEYKWIAQHPALFAFKQSHSLQMQMFVWFWQTFSGPW